MKKENSLKINIAERTKRTLQELLPGAFAVFAAAFGFSAMLFGAFSSAKAPAFAPILTGIAVAFCVLLSDKKYGKYVPLGISAVCLLLIFASVPIKNGILLLANDVLEFMTVATGRVYLLFEVSENANAGIALLLAAFAFSMPLSTALSEKTVIPALPLAILSIVGLAVGFLSTDIYFIVFAGGLIGILILVFSPKNSGKTSAKNVFLCFAVPLACALLCTVLIMFVPPKAGENIENFVKETAHFIFYDSRTNAMPEGDFENLGAFEKNGAPALEITMEKPQKLYLKGFVGEVYDGSGWEELEKETLAKYADDFYLLHREGFFGQSAVSHALEVTGENENTVLNIKNISACSKRAYLPYALSLAPFDEAKIGDAETESFGKEYSISYIPGGLSEWYLAQVELSEKQEKNEEVAAYLENEYVYRKFVKENYLDVPAGAYKAIEKIFAEEDASTSTEIISAILLYLKKNVSYDEEIKVRNGSEDFTAFFLEKTARGYSVHYATAATLMLRYFGIPARYAEGYFLSAAEAAEYESGETITLTENHAHAWTEYYLEGVGWVPFEVTPGYMDDELEKAAFSTSGGSSKQYEQSELPETNVDQERPKDDITEAKRNYTLVIVISVSAAALLLLAAVIYVIIMRKCLKKALLAIESADNKTGAAMRFGYAVRLLENADIPDETLESMGYDRAFEVNREALFSEHEITDEQRKIVDDYAGNVLSKCKRQWSFLQKIKNRWIKFLY